MSIRTRFRGWRRRNRRRRAAKTLAAPLREFVYLDEVSVYSLIASRLGPIATEFTDTESRSLRGEISSSLEGNAGVARGNVTSRAEAALTEGSQVVRKSIVQTTFRELVELEANSLRLRPMDDQAVPKLGGVEVLAGDAVKSSQYEGWIVDPKDLNRGQMIEVEVALEADSIFRVSAVMTAILEMLQENVELFGVVNVAQLSQARSMNRVIEKLLTGLVPVRGRAVDYQVVEQHGRELLVHRALLEQLPISEKVNARPLFVVGVADQALFWKDIRRVLFSNFHFRVFCRIGQSGLRDDWTPVKLVDVLREIAPELSSQIGMLGEGALVAMGDAVAGKTHDAEQKVAKVHSALAAFAGLLNEHHGCPLDEHTVAAVISSVAAGADPDAIDSVSRRRVLFGEIAQKIDELIDTETSKETAAQYRVAAIADIGLGLGGTLVPAETDLALEPHSSLRDRYLDTEIVAIYW